MQVFYPSGNETLFSWGEENQRTKRNSLSIKGKKQQQTQPTCGTGLESNPGHISGKVSALTTKPSLLYLLQTGLDCDTLKL